MLLLNGETPQMQQTMVKPNEDFDSPKSSSPPLSVNCLDPNSILQICPQRPLLSSQTMGWDGLMLKRHRQPAHTTPVHQLTQHTLILSPLGAWADVDYVLGDQHVQGGYGDGVTAIVPAHTLQQCQWYQTVEFLSLSLGPQSLVNVADESMPERFELLPRLGVRDPLIYDIGTTLEQELAEPECIDILYIDFLVTALIMHLLKRYTGQPVRLENASGKGLSQASLRLVLAYINDSLGQNLRLNDVAAQVGMSRFYFARLFKESMGMAPHQYVIQQRVGRAKKLLCESDVAIATIAKQCGFTNPSHLSKYFRQLTGATPKAYRSQYR